MIHPTTTSTLVKGHHSVGLAEDQRLMIAADSGLKLRESTTLTPDPLKVVMLIDNLRAAVTRADWYDPDINPKVEEFCRHYGTVIMPTRPANHRR